MSRKVEKINSDHYFAQNLILCGSGPIQEPQKNVAKRPIFAKQEMKLAIAKLTIEYIFPMLSEVIFHTIPSVIHSRPSVPSEFQLPFLHVPGPIQGTWLYVFGLIGNIFQFHRKTSFSSFRTKIRPNGFFFTIGPIWSYLRNVLRVLRIVEDGYFVGWHLWAQHSSYSGWPRTDGICGP